MRTVQKNGIWKVKVEKSEQKTLVAAEAILVRLGRLIDDIYVAETARRIRSAVETYCGDIMPLVAPGMEPKP